MASGGTCHDRLECAVNPPGSATAKDDDYYLAGSYPAPVGTLAGDEPIANFERAITAGDPRNRIHFPLGAAQVSADSRLRLTIDLSGGGAWINGSIPGFSTHDITVRFNGNVLVLKWVDPEVAKRYGTMVYVRCGA